MKKLALLVAIILGSYGLIATIADTTFSWSNSNQTGTLNAHHHAPRT